MSLQVNFTSHGHELKAAYEAILRPSDPKNGDNWAMFGYDKGTNDLKVLGQGNGGLEELEDEFVDGKIQYAFVRIVDPNSQLNKFVLIAWCGDGVPESKKGLFNSHLADVSLFLKGYHLQINARSEADVTPAQIMKRVNEGSGSKYSIHKETYQAEKIQPLQSAYKRTHIPDIAALQRNPTKPEPAPKYNVGASKFGSSSSPTSSTSTPSKIGERTWPPVQSSSSSFTQDAPSPPSSKPADRSWRTSGGSSYSASTGPSFKVQPPSSLLSFGQSSPEPVVNKAHQIRLEREAREKEERERIKREIEASEARQRQAEGPSTAQKLAEERRLQEQREREREQERSQEQELPRSTGQNRVREERIAREKEERERAEAEDAARSAREAAKAREESSIREQAVARQEEQLRQREQHQRQEREAQEAEERRAEEQRQQQRQQQEGEEEEARARQQQKDEDERRFKQQQQQKDEDERRFKQQQQQKEDEERRLKQQQQEEEEAKKQRLFEQEQEEIRRREQHEAEEQERRLEEEVRAATAQSVALGADALMATSGHPEDATTSSVSAIVLYSYDKAEENEMTLFEGEIIRNVTELDVGWWSGESEDGTRSGLFPANYVEVIEHANEHQHGAVANAFNDEQEHQYQNGQAHDYSHDVHAQAQETPAHLHHETANAGQGKKPSAVALYDYSAGEPNEISFLEGQTIVEIEFVTDDWWSGKNEQGATGLFPANYVEVIAQ
ncbi:hypothetical protein BG011_001868 [Mortierella polycephala]|uniref:Uncharacterized protein n=1 Tax=Mortierella polycephala TaxID=41804 RepID=A0A9P6Q4I8_9FUNG|nr:hypothetical protein BG011_001868 [Mortierella polycephala]